MVNKSRRQLTNVPEKPVELSDVNEIGVYYKDRTGKWIAIEPEIVHIKSGGWLKSTATHGIIKEDHNGHLNGRESKLALQCPIEILIYVPEGVSATSTNSSASASTPTTASSASLPAESFTPPAAPTATK